VAGEARHPCLLGSILALDFSIEHDRRRVSVPEYDSFGLKGALKGVERGVARAAGGLVVLQARARCGWGLRLAPPPEALPIAAGDALELKTNQATSRAKNPLMRPKTV
jgi:hypothetical protein